MENAELIRLINSELATELPEKNSYEEIHAELSDYINNLIKSDFDRLLAYLYRIDVNEQKLKKLLQQFPQEDAGNIIASLIIERQEQKIKTRQLFSSQASDIDEDEKW